jgi:hypothetical protein
VYFVVCTLAVKKKKLRAGFDMSDRTIPLSALQLVAQVAVFTPTDVETIHCFQGASLYVTPLRLLDSFLILFSKYSTK